MGGFLRAGEKKIRVAPKNGLGECLGELATEVAECLAYLSFLILPGATVYAAGGQCLLETCKVEEPGIFPALAPVDDRAGPERCIPECLLCEFIWSLALIARGHIGEQRGALLGSQPIVGCQSLRFAPESVGLPPRCIGNCIHALSSFAAGVISMDLTGRLSTGS